MPCKECGMVIIVGRGFCRRCYMRHLRDGTLSKHATKKRSLKERFLAFYSKITPNEKDCMEWPAQRRKDKFDYGLISIEVDGQKHSKLLRAHKVSYEIHKGQIPIGFNVLHTCDNPPCVNPLHLFLGTRGDNNKDCKKKGRNARGETNGRHKLTAKEVKLIRASNRPVQILARQFAVRQSTITRIQNGKRWGHLK